MNDHLSVETPEQININYQIAGIGSRFFAALLDTLLLGLIVIIGAYVNENFIEELGDFFGNWLGAIGGIVIFAIFWGYFMVFELTTNGQSPGKLALGLRVIKEGGYPINFADSAIRNLMRIVDFLPFCYGAGLLVMLLNQNWQRLGDLAAGTLVVRTTQTKLRNMRSNESQNTLPNSIATQEMIYAAWIKPMLVTEHEWNLILDYFHRHAELTAIRQLELSRTIGKPIAEKMEGKGSINYHKFLMEVYTLKTSEHAKVVEVSTKKEKL